MAKKSIYFKKQLSVVKDIKETIKVLEKISAANIHRLRLTTQRMLSYEVALKEIFSDLASGESVDHPLFKRPAGISRSLKIVLTTEQKFCGSLIHHLLDFFLLSFQRERDDVLILGKIGKEMAEERGIKITYFFPASRGIPQEKEVREIEELVVSLFLSKKYSQIEIFYPSFESIAFQKPKMSVFLPFSQILIQEELKSNNIPIQIYPIYEPGYGKIVDYLIKDYLGLTFYQKLLETKLSELSSRTRETGEAASRAEKLIHHLSLEYFKEKRASVTKGINDLYGHRFAWSKMI